MHEEIQGYLARLEEEPHRIEILEKLTKLLVEFDGDALVAAKALAGAAERIASEGEADTALSLLDLEERLHEEGSDGHADLLYRKGRLLEEELLDEASAIKCYQEILSMRPGDSGAEERMSHINLVRENWEKIVKKYLDEAEASTDATLTTSLYRSVAEIYQKNVPGSAEVERYLRKSLEVDPHNTKSAAHLERLLQQAERWDDLVAFYREQLERLEEPSQRFPVILALGRCLGRRLGDRDGMKEQYRAILEVDPAHPTALRSLADAYQEDENWEDLIQIYERSLSHRSGGKDIGLMIQIGMLWWKKVGDLTQAEPYFAKVKKAQPTSPIALDFYRSFYAEQKDWNGLLKMLQHAQRVSREPEQKQTLTREMAEVAEHQAGLPDKAIDLWKTLQRQHPDDPDAKAALRRLYHTAEKWNALLEILKQEEAKLPAGDVAARVRVLQEMVSIYRDKLQLDVMVINTYNAILALDPTHEGALDALAAKYEGLERWNDLIGVLGKKADLLDDPAEKKVLLSRIASLWLDEFSNPNKAIGPLEQILVLDPEDRGALTQLKEIYKKRRNWRGLLGLYEREVSQLPAEDQRPLLLEMAELAQKRLGDPTSAIHAWNRVLELDDYDPDAIEALIALYDRERSYPPLAEMLERRIALSTDEESVSLLERLGALWGDRIGSSGQAISVWKRVLSLRPNHSKATRVLRDLYASEGDWTALESLFAVQGSWTDYIETLLQAADRSKDVALQVKLYSKVAETWIQKVERPERAVKAYERILAVDPENLEAAQALVPIYEGAQKWPRLHATYEVLLDHSQAPEERIDLMQKLWTLCETKLGSKRNAFDWCAQAYVLSPQDPSIQEELERLAKESDGYEKLSVLYTQRVGALDDPVERVRLQRRLATITLENLNHPEEALGHYEAILAEQPEDRESLLALESICQSLERWPRLLEIFDRRIEMEDDTEGKLELLFRAGTLQEDILKEYDGAVAVYQRVLDLDSANLRALRALENLHVVRDDHAALAEVLRRQLDLTEDSNEQVGLLHRLGTLYEEQLGDTRQAIDFFQRALDKDKLHRPTIAALEHHLDPPGEHTVEVSRLLAPFYETTEDWSALARALEIQLQAEEDDTESLSLMKRLSALYGRKMGDADRAFGNAKRVFSVSPEDEENRAELCSLADALQDYEALLDLFIEGFDDREPDLQLSLAREIAGLFDTNLHDAEKARSWYERVLSLDEQDTEAFHALHRLLQESEAWSDLRDLLDRRIELEEDAEARKALLLQVCALNEDVLADVDGAIASYRQVLDVEPGSEQAFSALERLYEVADRWADLESLLAQEYGYAEDPQRTADLQFRRGQLLAERLKDADGAVDLFTEVLSQDETHSGALAALEALLDNADQRQRVAAILGSRYEALGEYAKQVSILEVQLEAAPDEHAKVDLLAQIAELQSGPIMDPDAAFTTWRRAFAILPGESRVRDALDQLIDTAARWQDAAEVWQEGLNAADESDVALRDELTMRLAQLSEHQLADPEQATRWYRELLDRDPSNLEMARPAADALQRLYEIAGDWTNLVAILRQQVEWAEESDSRKDLLYRIAEIQETALEQPDAAIETFREIVDQDPEEDRALDSLERLFFQSEQWADLVGILQRRTEVSPSIEERRALRGRVAMLYEEALGDAEEACSAWLSVLDEAPEDIEAIRALARLYEQASRWNDLLDMLERELSLLEDGRDRIALTFRMGRILQEKLEDSERAVYRYQQVLEEDATHQEARKALEELLGDTLLSMQIAEILEPIYATESQWEKLCSIYKLRAEATADPSERVRLYGLIAEKQEMGLQDAEAAFRYYGLALKEALSEPTLHEILGALERLAAQGERWEDLVALYRDVADDILDATLQEQVRLSVAEISRLHLKDLDTAETYFRQVLDADPESERSLDALEQIYQQTEQWEPLLQIYLSRADLSADSPPVRRSYLSRAANLCEEFLDRPEQAVGCWEQIREMDPTDRDAAQSLERLYGKGERWADLADLIESRFQYVDSLPEAVDLRYQLGTILRHQLDEPDRALENYRGALGGDPTHAEAIDSIERYLDDEDRRSEAAEVLEPIYAARQDWKRLVDVYQIRREYEGDPDQKARMTRRIAMLYEEQLEDLDEAFVWYGHLFRERPENQQIREQLTRLAGIQEKYAELADIFATYLADVYEETDETLDVAEQLARIYDERLGDVDHAKEVYLRILAANRERPGVFESLERILTRAERWQDLLDVYREAAEAAMEPEQRKQLLFRICTIWEEAIGELDEAIDAYRAVLDMGDNDRRAVSALDRLLVQQGRWTDLVELLHRQLDEAAGPGEVIPIKLRLGSLYEERLDDVSSAIDTYEEVLQIEAGNPDAIAALERLISNEDERLRVAQILEPIYKALDNWQQLVVVYEVLLAAIDDPTRRVEILRDLSTIHEQRSGDLVKAFEATAQAWKEDVSDPDVLQALESLASRIQDWPRLVAVLEEGIAGSYDYELQAHIWLKIARIHEEATADPEAAVKAYYKLLDVKEDSEEAISALERLLPGLGRWPDLVSVLRKKAELTPDPLDAKDCYYQIAEVQESTLGQPEEAISTLQQLLSIDETDEVALSSLERLYLGAEQWADLVGIYQRKLETLSDPADRRTVLYQMAYVHETKLEEAFEAISSYQRVIEEQGDDVEALVALNRLFTNEQNWVDLLDVLDRQVALTPDPAGRNDLIYRAGWVLQNEMNDLEGAIEKYRGVLQEDPGYGDARQALEALIRTEDGRDGAAAVLEPLYRAAGEFDALAEVLELRVAAEMDPASKADLLKQLAQLHEEGRSDSQAAFDAYARGFSEDPADEDIRTQLERLAQSLSAWQQLAEHYETRLKDIYDDDLARRVTLTLARLFEEALGDDQQAIEKFRSALDLGGDEAEPLAALDRLLERGAQWKDLAEILQREVDATSDPEAQAAYLFRLGTLRRQQFSDQDGALAAFRDVLDRLPEHAGALAVLEEMTDTPECAERALDILEPLYESTGNHERMLWLGTKRLALLDDPFDRAQLLERIADIAETQMGDPARAMEAVSGALTERPDEPRYLERLEQLAETLGRWAEAAAALETLLDRDDLEEHAQLSLALKCADWYAEHLGDVQRSQQYYDRVLQIEPEHAQALAKLETIYRSVGDIQALVGILERKAELDYDLESKKSLLAEVADLAENALGDPATAASAWKTIVEQDEADEQAQNALVRLYEAAEAWEDLVVALERKARFALDPSMSLTLRHRMGEIFQTQISDLDRAAEAYRDCLDIEPDDEVALDALEVIHASQEDYNSVQDILLRRLSLLDPGPARVPVLERLARLAEERFDNMDEAFDYWHQVASVDPSHPRAYTELERILSKAERWYDLVDVLKKKAEAHAAMGDTTSEVETLTRIARLWQEQLESPDAAADILKTILDKDPNNVTALSGLARLHEQVEEWDQCKEILARAAGLGPQGREAAELYLRMGAVEAKLGNADDAYGLVRQAVDHDATHQEALQTAETMARDRSDWAEVARMLDLRLQATENPQAKLPVLTDLGTLWADRLGQPDSGLPYLEQAIQIAPEDPQVLAPLGHLYYVAGRLDEAEPLFRGLIESTSKTRRRAKELAPYHHRLGSIAEARGDLDAAAKEYDAAYRIDTSYTPVVLDLGRLAMSQQDWEKARRIYRALLLQNIDEATAGITKADVYYNLGLIHEQLGETKKAINMFERGLEVRSDHTDLQTALARVRG